MSNDIKDLLTDSVNLSAAPILFLDLSSSCTGFAIMEVDFVKKEATLTKAGAIWFGDDWSHGKKYDYMYKAIQNYFDVIEGVCYVAAEQYSINTKKMTGCLVSPELHGAIKAACYDVGIKIETVLPQTWRSRLGIKGVGIVGKRDYKAPTKARVLQEVSIPETVISNITGKSRTTPSDLYDAVAIGMAWLKGWNIKLLPSAPDVNTHIGD